LSRIIYGSRTSLIIGIVAITASAFVGMSLGMLAGYFGRWTFMVIMRIIDAMMSFPLILLALLFVAIFGAGLKNVIIALGVGLVPMYTRMMCGQVLAVKQSDYIIAARSIGCTDIRIMLFHILRNTFPALIVQITMMMGACILAEASLSYLGLGIAPPQAAWGAMVFDGYKYLLVNPVLSFAPGLAIMLVVFAFNMMGDGLRDALDPKLRGLL
jgi:ABC-type dipeptide/oligopeptide/nickel transport system permease subunit